ENEQSRQALIEQLRALARGQAAHPAGDAAAAKTPQTADAGARGLPREQGDTSLSRRIAEDTQQFIGELGQDLAEAAAAFRSLGRGEGVRGVTMEAWLAALTELAVVVAATLAAWMLFRALASRVYAR